MATQGLTRTDTMGVETVTPPYVVAVAENVYDVPTTVMPERQLPGDSVIEREAVRRV